MMCQVMYTMLLKPDNHGINCYSHSYTEKEMINSISYISSSQILGYTKITMWACWK